MHERHRLGTGIKADSAGIGIRTSDISVRYQSIPVSDWVPLFCFRSDRYRTDRMPDSPSLQHLQKLYEG
jgi:hypothetical protein